MKTFQTLVAMAVVVFSVPALASSPSGSSRSTGGNNLLDDVDSGGYGAPVVRYSPVGSTDQLFVGARGGWIINHSFVIGGAAYGLATSYQLPGDRLTFGYGGLMLEYIAMPQNVFHVAFDTVIGGGAVAPRNSTSPSAVVVLEPELDGVVNLSSSVRAGLGLSYRMTRGKNVANLTSSDLSGFGGNLFVQFGSF